MEHKYPHLHSFARNENISMKDGIQANNSDIYEIFHLPLSLIAHEELHSLRNDINDIEQDDEYDSWTLDSGPVFSKKMYRTLVCILMHKTILDIWKTCNIPRQKFFI